MIFYINIRIEKAKKGYILKYKKYMVSQDSHDGYGYLGDYTTEVFEDLAEAMKRMNELCDESDGVGEADMILKEMKKSKE